MIKKTKRTVARKSASRPAAKKTARKTTAHSSALPKDLYLVGRTGKVYGKFERK